jgi:hypothetical protein
LFLNADGTMAASQEIGEGVGGFGGDLDLLDSFGFCVATLGDLDGDGVTDVAVGAPFDDDGGNGRGAVWILFLNVDGTVKAEQKISTTEGALGGPLDNGDNFGMSIAALGDLDGDGIEDIAVGASGDDDVDGNSGALWILFLNTDGTVGGEQKVSQSAGGFPGDLSQHGVSGSAAVALGDLNGDGVVDLGVGAPSNGLPSRRSGSSS